jgi:hypothetical protein
MVRVIDNPYQLGVKIKTADGEINVPDDLVDPITYEVMRDPVKLTCGHSIDRAVEGNIKWVKDHGCALCRRPCDLSQIVVDQEKWDRVRQLLSKEKPKSWTEHIREFFAEFKIRSKRITQLSIEYSPTTVSHLQYIADPVYQRALSNSLGRSKGMGIAFLHAEARFASMVMLSVACLVRDLVASLFLLLGWCFSDRFCAPLAKRISYILASFLHTAGMCYGQIANRRMYMGENMRQEHHTMAFIERMDYGFSETVEHVRIQMGRSLLEARHGLYSDYVL